MLLSKREVRALPRPISPVVATLVRTTPRLAAESKASDPPGSSPSHRGVVPLAPESSR